MDTNQQGPRAAHSRMPSFNQFDQRVNPQLMASEVVPQHQTQLNRPLREVMQLQLQNVGSNSNTNASKNIGDRKQNTQFKIVPTVMSGLASNTLLMELQPLNQDMTLLHQQVNMLHRRSLQQGNQVVNVDSPVGEPHLQMQNQQINQQRQLQSQQLNRQQLQSQQVGAQQTHQQQQKQHLQQSAQQNIRRQQSLQQNLQLHNPQNLHQLLQQQLFLRQQAQQLYQQLQLQQLQQLQSQHNTEPVSQNMVPPSSKSSPGKSGSVLGSIGATAGDGKQVANFGDSDVENRFRFFKRNLGNAAVSRVNELLDLIMAESGKSISTYEFWQSLCQNYAMLHAALRITVPQDPARSEDESDFKNTRLYTLSVDTAPRFFLANALATTIAKQVFTLPGLRFHILSNGSVFLVSKLSMLYTYTDNSTCHLTGFCRLLLGVDFRIELIDCHIVKLVSNVSLLQLEKRWLACSRNDTKERDFMKRLLTETMSGSAAKNCGFEENVLRILQISDVMAQLRPLIAFTSDSRTNSPIKSLDNYVSMNHASTHYNSVNSVGGNRHVLSPLTRNMPLDYKGPIKKRRVSNTVPSPTDSEPR